ncbi:MAG: NCS2 family permease [Clostridia bacterium]|nr:NCS2 family permease [Clostridia bacterium]
MSDEKEMSAEDVTIPADAPAETGENPGGGEMSDGHPHHSGFWGKVDDFFGISKAQSRFRTEVIAGLVTFMSMVYIMMVNSSMFADAIDASYGIGWDAAYDAAYIATALGAIVGTLLMAFLAKMPLAMASGMGVNAFVVYTLVFSAGLSYANSMVFVLLDGVIFVVLTATGLREKIFGAIPKGVRYAIPVGIGLFIAFLGFQDAGVIVANDSTLTAFISFNVLGDNTFYAMIPALCAILGVIAIAVMSKKKVKGAVLWGILITAALYYILNAISAACTPSTEYIGTGTYVFNELTGEYEEIIDEVMNSAASSRAMFSSITWSNPFSAFKSWGQNSVGKVFSDGFNFSGYLNQDGNTVGSLVVLLITSALSLCMLDMFDTIGTLYGACSKGNLLDEKGVPLNMNRMMLADAIATCVGSVAGTSTVTTFVEASSGVSAGGRTGFTALVVGLCFVVVMFLSPIAKIIPSCATATALIWVGVLMMSSVTKIRWSDPAESLVAFMTFITMILGYSISKGIGIGIITYILVKICTGKIKKISIATWVIGILFLAMFLLAD